MKASIIIPTHQRPAYLLDAIESVRKQYFPADAYEILVVDNAANPSSETASLCNSCTAPLTRYIHEPRNGLHSQIKILGYVPNEDIVGLYKNALALVMPTFFGPTNIPIVEAFFLGVPVVCSNVYAMPEQVGEAWLLFDPNNIDDMAEKIYTAWTDENLRKIFIQKGYERAKDMTLENHAKQWEKVIEAAIRDCDRTNISGKEAYFAECNREL